LRHAEDAPPSVWRWRTSKQREGGFLCLELRGDQYRLAGVGRTFWPSQI